MEQEPSSQPPPAPSRYVTTTGSAVSPGETLTPRNQAQLQASISCIPGDKSVFKKLVRIDMLLDCKGSGYCLY